MLRVKELWIGCFTIVFQFELIVDCFFAFVVEGEYGSSCPICELPLRVLNGAWLVRVVVLDSADECGDISCNGNLICAICFIIMELSTGSIGSIFIGNPVLSVIFSLAFGLAELAED